MLRLKIAVSYLRSTCLFYALPKYLKDEFLPITFLCKIIYESDLCPGYGVFSHDVTAAMLVSQTSPVEVELLSYAKAFFCSN